ncbi:MAG: tetratricopeptide repeat protein [Bacteroidales bacterium]|nr:tetratricopeptide repeat protein [Bacteroidales bacterium]
MKKHIIKTIGLAGISVLLSVNSANAQNTLTTQQYNALGKNAQEKFAEHNYSDAYNDYTLLIKNYPSVAPGLYNTDNQNEIRADWYFKRAMCAYYLMNNDVDVLFNEYISLFPNSEKNTKAVFYIANWYIQKSEYAKALETYQTIDADALGKSEYLEYYYKIGYCLFLNGSYPRALSSFEKVKDSQSVYSSPAKYYYAHILYEQGKYKQALKEFEELRRDKYFKSVVPYYICQIYYLDGDYDKLIEMAPQLSEKSINSSRATELNRMLGDSYYKKGQYAEALPYIQKSIESNQAINRDDNYLMGYCLMQTGEYAKATNYLKQSAASESDAMAQNSLYYLGYCYLQAKDTTQAKNAYKGASEMNFDKDIQMESMFDYSKLCINDPGPYNEAIKNFQTYIKKYPKSPKKKEAQNYLVQLYERTRNYKDAMELMQQMDNRTKQMNEIYQKIAVNRGIELYNIGQYKQAIQSFDESLKYPLNNSLTATAYYLEAESYYKIDEYSKSITALNKFYSTPSYKTSSYVDNADYSMAYNLFKQKKYALAKNYFLKVTENKTGHISSVITNDSKLRLGDCEYMSRNFSGSIKYYDMVINEGKNNADYAYYQKAMALGAGSNHKAKSQTLQTAIDKFPSSTYRANMTYELANTYLALDENEKAMETYQQLIREYPSSANVKESLGKIGMLQYQAGNYNSALNTLDKLVKQYPNSAESKAALATIKNIYMDKGQTDEYFAYVKTIPNATVTNAEKEQMLYQTAENQYMDEKYKQAAGSFEKYLHEFPSSSNSDKATYYLADCLMHTGDTADAAVYYSKLAMKPTTQYTEKALVNAASYYEVHDKSQAIILYTRLDSISSSAANKNRAKLALMNIYYDNEQYASAIKYADEVLALQNLPKDSKDKAEYILAKSYLATSDNEKAKEYLNKTKESDNGEIAGESMYTLALIAYNDKDIDTSEKIIKSFSKNPSDEYYLAKAFILWADIFTDRGNEFQAKQTLKSIIDNYDNEEIIKQAQDKYDALEKKQQEQKQQNEQKAEEQQNTVDEIIIP